MSEDLVTFLKARLDEEADLARRCDGDGCGRWSADGHTVDFCQVKLAGVHPTTALHVALHDPARVLREVEAKRRILARHALSPAVGDPELPWDDRDDCHFSTETPGLVTTCSTSRRPTTTTLISPEVPEVAQPRADRMTEAPPRAEPATGDPLQDSPWLT
ncbi:DUF6221 family protein [Streptomyces sp. NPDC048383]|uniref:DUF6221 family protein n=1 Tax=Streptomyces sp. NPDC048383 TaxID=3155386 RepID=UPI003415FA4B